MGPDTENALQHRARHTVTTTEVHKGKPCLSLSLTPAACLCIKKKEQVTKVQVTQCAMHIYALGHLTVYYAM